MSRNIGIIPDLLDYTEPEALISQSPTQQNMKPLAVEKKHPPLMSEYEAA